MRFLNERGVVLFKALKHHPAARLAADRVARGGGADDAVADQRAGGIDMDVAGIVDAVGDHLGIGGDIGLFIDQHITLRGELIIIDEPEAVVTVRPLNILVVPIAVMESRGKSTRFLKLP